MAKKDTQELLVAGGIIGLLVFGIHKLFIEKKQPKETTTTGADETPVPPGAIPGITDGEQVGNTGGDNGTTGGGMYLPDYIPPATGPAVISDPFPWMQNPDTVQAAGNSGSFQN